MKKALIYGAGSIGRGFLGQLFFESGFEVVFVDIDTNLVRELNKAREYPLTFVSKRGSREIIVRNVRATDGRDIAAVSEQIAGAEIVATAVGVPALPAIAGPLAAGLTLRWEQGNLAVLNIIACENLLHANEHLRQLVKESLPSRWVDLLDATVGFVETCIGRNIPVMTPELCRGNPLRVIAEEYSHLPVDAESIRGEMPAVTHMFAVSPFEPYVQRKLYMYNMAHAVVAYLGHLAGKKYLWEACRDSAIKLVALRALTESAKALSREHHLALDGLMNHAEDLLRRFQNRSLGITIERTGKDPLRKLSNRDRLIGSAKLCTKHAIAPVFVSIGAAAAFLFADMQREIERDSIEEVIFRVCGLLKTDPVAKSILRFYGLLKDGTPLETVIELAEEATGEQYQETPLVAQGVRFTQ